MKPRILPRPLGIFSLSCQAFFLFLLPLLCFLDFLQPFLDDWLLNAKSLLMFGDFLLMPLYCCSEFIEGYTLLLNNSLHVLDFLDIFLEGGLELGDSLFQLW